MRRISHNGGVRLGDVCGDQYRACDYVSGSVLDFPEAAGECGGVLDQADAERETEGGKEAGVFSGKFGAHGRMDEASVGALRGRDHGVCRTRRCSVPENLHLRVCRKFYLGFTFLRIRGSVG